MSFQKLRVNIDSNVADDARRSEGKVSKARNSQDTLSSVMLKIMVIFEQRDVTRKHEPMTSEKFGWV